MSKMKLEQKDHQPASTYNAKLERWTSKELQLNILHEEILNKREALLRTSRNFLSRGKREVLMNNTEATIRNDKLLKDMKGLEETISEHLIPTQSPRFATLQVNYWSMVKNMIPIWQKSMQEADEKTAIF